MAQLTFSDEQKKALQEGRFEHPHPRVQLRMEVLCLISLGETYSNAARLAGVSDATVDPYGALYRCSALRSGSVSVLFVVREPLVDARRVGSKAIQRSGSMECDDQSTRECREPLNQPQSCLRSHFDLPRSFARLPFL